MSGSQSAPAATTAEGHAAAGIDADHRAASVTFSIARMTLHISLLPEARRKPGSGEHKDARRTEIEWTAFFRTEWPSVVRVLQASFPEASVPDAADAAQNAFIDLFSQWDDVSSPRAWVRKVAFRHMVRQHAKDQALLHKLSDTAHPEAWCAPASGPLEISDEQQNVLAALRRLPEAQRQVIALAYDGFTTKETAEMLGATEAAVRQSLRRGRRKLNDMLNASDHALGRVP